jgi:hypothetical protein
MEAQIVNALVDFQKGNIGYARHRRMTNKTKNTTQKNKNMSTLCDKVCQ